MNALTIARHWRRVRTLTLVLLAIWLVVSVGVGFFARELAAVSLGGWPLHFYLASQGVTWVYLALIGVYAVAVSRLEALARNHDAERGADDD
jgi:putative solute:sodium symporter small subunit